MGVLNQASDGLPSVLFALVRALRHFGPLTREELLARCCPPSLQPGTAGKQGTTTLTRWTQLGLFTEVDGLIHPHPEFDGLPVGRVQEVAGVAGLLRRIVLAPANNRDINLEEPRLAGDLSLGLCWALAQDVFALPGGVHREVEKYQSPQFSDKPLAFHNDTRWNGFRSWAPLLGFGWTEAVAGSPLLVVDPTAAVRDELSGLFAETGELPIGEFMRGLAERIPVLDGGEYRLAVEQRLVPAFWRATRPHEVSISLSAALLRLDGSGAIRFAARADAPKRTLLGAGHREMQQVSHIVWGGQGNA